MAGVEGEPPFTANHEKENHHENLKVSVPNGTDLSGFSGKKDDGKPAFGQYCG